MFPLLTEYSFFRPPMFGIIWVSIQSALVFPFLGGIISTSGRILICTPE